MQPQRQRPLIDMFDYLAAMEQVFPEMEPAYHILQNEFLAYRRHSDLIATLAKVAAPPRTTIHSPVPWIYVKVVLKFNWKIPVFRCLRYPLSL